MTTEEKRLYKSNYYLLNKTKIADKAKKHARLNRAAIKARKKKWYERCKKKCNSQSRAYYRIHKDELLEKNKASKRANADRARQADSRHKDRRRRGRSLITLIQANTAIQFLDNTKGDTQ